MAIKVAGNVVISDSQAISNITTINANGNIEGNYFIGNGSQLTGIDATAIQNGTANVRTFLNGNVTVSAAGAANVLNVTSTGANIVGTINVSSTGLFGGNIDMSGFTVSNLAVPNNASDAATKQYVDDFVQGLNIHDSCGAATPDTLANLTTGTITYNNGTSGVNANLVTSGSFNLIDGVNVQTAGTRILVKNEANAVHNGIYTWANSTTIVRATDFNSVPEVEAGDYTFVTAGTLYDNTGWVQTESPTGIGTAGNNINFTQFSGAGSFTAGTGLTLTGTVFSVNASQTQVTEVGTLGNLSVTSNITAGNANVSGQLISTVSTGTAPLVVTSTTVVANLNANALQGNTPSQSATANTIVQRNADGNITANFFIGNGSQLTGLSGASLSNGTSNVNIATSGGNVTVGVGGTSGITTFTTTGINVSGVLNSSRFIESPYPIVAPLPILNKGTGALGSIGAAIASGSGPEGIATDPSGRFVYVTNYGAYTISQYSIDQSTGALTQITTDIGTNFNPRCVVVDPTGRFLYAGAFAQSCVNQYSINQSTGALTSLSPVNRGVGTQPHAIAADPTGRFIYVAGGNDDVAQLSINQSTGALTLITTNIAAGSAPRGITVDPTGRFVYVTNSASNTISQYSINQATGALTSITTAIASGASPFIIAVDPSGRFVYATNNTDNTISQYSINQATGALTSITTAIASGAGPKGIAVDPTGRFVYVINSTDNTISQYSINQATGALTSITTAIASGTSPWAIATDPTGRFSYATNNSASTVSQYRISNFSSGSATIAGNLDVSGYLTGNGALLTGLSIAGVSNGNSNVNIPAANGNVNISAAGNANVLVVTGTGIVSGSGTGGNLSGANVITANTFTATGNITANFFIGNGSALTGLSTAGVSNGNSNVNIPAANGNVNISAVGNANVLVVTGTGANINGTVQGTRFISNIATGTAPLTVTSTTVVANLNANALQGNTPDQTATANTIVQRNASGNITANFFIGNGSALTGLSSAGIANGNSNVNIPTSAGNILMSVNGTANVVTVSNTNVVIGSGSGGNLSGANVITANTFTGAFANGNSNVNIPTASSYVLFSAEGNANVLTITGTSAVFGNGSGGNISGANVITANSANILVSLGVGTAPSGTTGEIRATNNITAYYSDKRLKTNIVTIEGALEKLCAISGVYFRPNEVAQGFGYDNKLQVGVIAQEIEAVLPEIVTRAPFDIIKDKEGNEISKSGENYKTVWYDKLIPLVIEAVKELKVEVDVLKNKIK